MNYWVVAFVFAGIAFLALFVNFVSLRSLSSSILNDCQKANLVLDVLIPFVTILSAYKIHLDSNRNQAKITPIQLLVFV
jgi:hypothetical protein